MKTVKCYYAAGRDIRWQCPIDANPEFVLAHGDQEIYLCRFHAEVWREYLANNPDANEYYSIQPILDNSEQD